MLWKRNAAIVIGGVKATGLRIAFDIEKTNIGREANKATITVYNLNETTRTLTQKKDTVVILEVGYGENLEQLFVDNITKSSTKRQGADIVTTLEYDNKALRETRFNKSYSAGVSIKTTIKEVAQTFRDAGGVIIGNLGERFASIDDKQEQTGLALSGMAKDVMDDLIGKLDLEWNIQDNELHILKPDEGIPGEEAVLLTPQTGLIGSPAKREDDGVEFMCLIIPGIYPGKLIQIRSKHIFETYKVIKAIYRGDTHGQLWNITGWGKVIRA